MSLNIAIVGPGRSKQGTGPYIARTFSKLGTNICGVTSSSLASAKTAVQQLKNDYDIECNAYATLEELLQNNPVDIVIISSPVDSHMQYIEIAIHQGCHIFCEKPLWWPAQEKAVDVEQITATTTKLVRQCINDNLVLQLNTQWPFTLPAYYKIYPEQESEIESVKKFSMWLSPQSTDDLMIIDAVPHVLSMLYAIVGGGRIQNIQSDNSSGVINHAIAITFDYLHAMGDTMVSINLNSSDALPKPAAYAINGKRVDRHVELSNYLISLQTSDIQVPVMDPLECSIKNFISTIYSKTSSDEVVLIDGVIHLAQIYLEVTKT